MVPSRCGKRPSPERSFRLFNPNNEPFAAPQFHRMTVLQLFCPYDRVYVSLADERPMRDEVVVFTEAVGSIFNHTPL
jgi:hypothetical protein